MDPNQIENDSGLTMPEDSKIDALEECISLGGDNLLTEEVFEVDGDLSDASNIPDFSQHLPGSCGNQTEEGSTDTAARINLLESVLLEARNRIQQVCKERDHHRMACRRITDDRDKLAFDLRVLKAHIEKHDPEIQVLREKYVALMKEKTLLRIDRDRLAQRLSSTFLGADGGEPPNRSKGVSVKSFKHSAWTAWPKSVSPNPPSPPVLSNHPSHRLVLTESTSVQSHSVPTSCLAFDRISRAIAAGGDDNTISFFSSLTSSKPETFRGHTSFIASLAFRPNSPTTLFSSSGDGSIFVWDTGSGSVLAHLGGGHHSCVWSIDIHEDGGYLVSGSVDQTAKLFDLQVGKCRHALRGHVDSVNVAKFYSSHSLSSSPVVVTGSADKSVSIWDIRTAHCAHTIYSHTSVVNAIDFSGAYIGSADASGNVHITDCRTMKPLIPPTTVGSCITSILWEEEAILVGCRDGDFRVINSATGEITSTVSTGPTSILGLARIPPATGPTPFPHAIASVSGSGVLQTWGLSWSD